MHPNNSDWLILTYYFSEISLGRVPEKVKFIILLSFGILLFVLIINMIIKVIDKIIFSKLKYIKKCFFAFFHF